jgi:hypothetical protein
MAADAPRGQPRPRAEKSPHGRAGKTGAFSISLFLMALLMFMPPILTLSEGPEDLFGLPRVFVYLFAVWLTVVALIALIVVGSDRQIPPEG